MGNVYGFIKNSLDATLKTLTIILDKLVIKLMGLKSKILMT